MSSAQPAKDDYLNALFSIVFSIDSELRIENPSTALLRHMPQLADRPSLDKVFQLHRPRHINSFDEAARAAGSLILMVSRNKRFAVRGQWIIKEQAGEKYLIFCGAPWVSWMVQNRLEENIQLIDFSAQDVQLDILFYMSTETKMITDLETINSALLGAKAELEQAQKQKSVFFAQMSHEIRTPLNAVISALRLLQDKPLSSDAKLLTELARESSDNLMHVVNYVLDVSKMDADEKPEKLESIVLDKFANSVVDVVRPRALEKRISLNLMIEREIPDQMSTSPDLLRQVLLNLLNNAIKFTDTGSVTLSIAKASDGLLFSVEDTGLGIAEAETERVFERYKSQRLGDDFGTGLGLDICRRNVERLGGQIGLNSTLGDGSCFWFIVPSDVPGVEYEAPEQQEEKPISAQLQGNILLVDDNATNLLLESQILESIGLTVTRADSGKSALEFTLKEPFDLVLMDINMPDMDGHETTAAIRNIAGKENLPIVALTAYASSEEAGKSMKSGMNGYLTKPIDVGVLLEELGHWLNTKSQGRTTPHEHGNTLLDIDVIDTLIAQIGDSGLQKVLLKFTEETHAHINTLESEVDNESVLRSLHILKSTSKSLGLDAAANAFLALETAAKQAHFPDEITLIGTRALMEKSLQAIKDHLSHNQVQSSQ